MKAVILAGGLGKRLRPFTEIIPKPLLPMGERALMEIQIEHLKRHGFDDIYVAVYYKSDYVRSFLGDGSRYGVTIEYSEERTPLGTCGPLSLLKGALTEPFLVMNGDILSKADLGDMYRFSMKDDMADLTIATKIIYHPFRFGNVFSEGDYVIGIEEKPDLEYEVLAGIYILKPHVFSYIPDDTSFGMDELIKKLLEGRKRVLKYRLKEYWLDIGQIDDYDAAVEMYAQYFNDGRDAQE